MDKLALNHFLPYRLVNLAGHISDAFSSVYRSEADLSVGEWRILVNLAEFGENNAKVLGELATMDKSTVSRAVKSLLDKALIERKSDPSDKRAGLLSLTEQGLQLYQALAPKALAWEAELIAALDSREYRDFMIALDKLAERVESIAK